MNADDSTASATHVGRAAEVRAVADLLDRTIHGQPGIAWIEGDPGIGKTTIFEQAVASATAFRILRCRPVEAEAGSVFLGLADLLDGVDDQVFARLPDPQRVALEVALVRSSEPASGWHAAALGLATLLRDLSGSSPILVAIDDAHWLDEPSARVVASAARRVGSDPVAFVLASRPRPANAFGSLPRDAADRLTRIEVGPLTIGALHRVLTDKLGVTLPRPQLARLHAATRGNPLFAIEFVRTLTPGARIDFEHVPPTLQPLLASRIEGLSDAAVEVLGLAALLARPTPALVRRAAAIDAERGSAEAERADLLVETGDAITFKHPLLASAVLDLIPAAQRRVMHGTLAQLVEDPVERARHVLAAADGPDLLVADDLEQAARIASSRGDSHTAGTLFEQSARLTPADDPALSGRLRRAGQSLASSGESERAADLMQRSLDLAAPGRERALCAVCLAATVAMAGDLARSDLLHREAVAQELPVDEMARWLLVFARWAQMYDLDSAAEQAARGLEFATKSQNPARIAAAKALVITSDVQRGRPAALDGARALAAGEMAEQGAESATSFVGELLRWTDRLDEISALSETELAEAEQGGALWTLIQVLDELADIACRAGDFRRARTYAQRGLEDIADPGQFSLNAIRLLGIEAVASAALGDNDAAAAAEQLATDLVGNRDFGERWAGALAAFGLARLLASDAEAAVDLLERCHAMATAIGIVHPGVILYRADLAEALLEVGRLDDAERIAAALEADGDRLGNARAVATGARAAGMVMAAKGDLDGAIASFDRSLAAHDAVPSPFELARTLLVAGSLERRLKHKKQARDLLTHARDLSEAGGFAPLLERATEELTRIGGRPPRTGDLTPTERAIAEAVAEGLTNAEVAARLFVSLRTVESNLTRVYRKVGVRSRTELAAKIRD